MQRPGSHHWAHQVYTDGKETTCRRDWLRKREPTLLGHCGPSVKMTLGLTAGRNPCKVKALRGCSLSFCSPTMCPALHRTLGVPSPGRGVRGEGVPRGRQTVSSLAHEEGHIPAPITSFNPQPPEGGGAQCPSYRCSPGGPQHSGRAWTTEPELVGVGLTPAPPHPLSPAPDTGPRLHV